jgi:AraC-like DNA-binding protein
MSKRAFSISLAAPPEIRTYGGFKSEQSESTWIQPADTWHVHWASYPGTIVMDGSSHPFPAHSVIIVPPRAHCRVERIGEPLFEYRFFAFAPIESNRDIVALPFMTHLPKDKAHVYEQAFAKCVRRVEWSKTSIGAFAYSFLWELAVSPSEPTMNPFTTQAESIIEAGLARPGILKEAAEQLGISPDQLDRHFREDHGCTAFQFLRDRRAMAAHRLLTSTVEPIKRVAALCGMPDANSFARFIRQKFGAPPRKIRLQRQAFDVLREGALKTSD